MPIAKANGIPRPLTSFSEETMGATLTGPIIPNRLFFAITYEAGGARVGS